MVGEKQSIFRNYSSCIDKYRGTFRFSFIIHTNKSTTQQLNNSTTQQLNLAKVEHHPNFYLKESYLFDREKGFANETELRIINSGAEVSNFNKKVISFLELEFYADKGRHISHIPVYGYYDTTFKETEPKGEIALIKGHMNNSIFNDLYKKTSTQEFRKNMVMFL